MPEHLPKLCPCCGHATDLEEKVKRLQGELQKRVQKAEKVMTSLQKRVQKALDGGKKRKRRRAP